MKKELGELSTKSTHVMPTSTQKEILELLMEKGYYEIGRKEQRQIADDLSEGRGTDRSKTLIKSFTFSVNPLTRETLQPEKVHDYIVFIDSRRSDLYTEVKEYLVERKLSISSFCTAGDGDFVAILHCHEDKFDEFLSGQERQDRIGISLKRRTMISNPNVQSK